MFDIYKRTLIALINEDNQKHILIPHGITEIAKSAFANHSEIESIRFPNSVCRIGDDAFLLCKSLHRVDIVNLYAWCRIKFEEPLSNPLFYRADLYFQQQLLKDIIIPKGIRTINDFAFVNCPTINTLKLSDSVIDIGKFAFINCTNLKSVDLANVKVIDEYAFCGCTSLEDVDIPRETQIIGNSAFAECKMSKINIGPKMVKIHETSFACCDNVKEINVDKDNENYYVYHCNSESMALIERNSQKIIFALGDSAIPEDENITSIGNYAFSGYPGLINLFVPKNIKEIGNRSFYNCRKIQSINVNKDNQCYSSKSNCLIKNDELILGCENSVIPEGIKTISNWAFSGCENLGKIEIPEGVEKIERGTFSHCTNLKVVKLPNSLKEIDECAFSDCVSLKDVFYNGNKDEWEKVKINIGNDEIKVATVYFRP